MSDYTVLKELLWTHCKLWRHSLRSASESAQHPYHTKKDIQKQCLQYKIKQSKKCIAYELNDQTVYIE